MANRDHSLDEKIVRAARDEFMRSGFQAASVKRIAEAAEVTTGAIYVRYTGKDDLFCSLVADAINALTEHGQELWDDYAALSSESTPDEFLAVLDKEMHILYQAVCGHYEAFILLFGRSEGAAVARELHRAFTAKAEGTVQFMERIAVRPAQTDAIRILIINHLHMYKEVLCQDFEKERALRCLRELNGYLRPVWQRIFAELI